MAESDRLVIPGNRGLTLIDILSSYPLTGLRQKLQQPQPQQPTGTPPAGNIGNCQGQVTVTYYVKDSPVVET